jgi:acyl transferase domain-containing protein
LINQTRVTQVALFAVELGLARTWQSRGVRPEAMIGHSLGEYVAGCLAGVMSEEQAIRLVAKRGALMQRARPGAMLAVALSESELKEKLRETGSRLEVAAINGPQQCVVSGEEEEIAGFEWQLNGAGIANKRLKTSHAFHSRMMEEVISEYEEEVGGVELKRPAIRYISNVSGKWITAEEAQEPGYWSQQMRAPVRYWKGLEQIGREIKERVFLEVGPGEALSRLGRQLSREGRQGDVTTLGSEAEGGARAMMEAVGRLWAHGVEIEWEKWRKGKRRRVELPGYAFEEQRYWVERISAQTGVAVVKRKREVGEWFYVPTWKETAVVMNRGEQRKPQRWLILQDEEGVGERIAVELERQGDVVARVKRARWYEQKGEREYWIRVGEAGDYQVVLKELEERGEWPDKIVHLFSLSHGEGEKARGWEGRIEKAAEAGFYSLAYLAQGIGQRVGVGRIEVVVVSNGVVEVAGEEEVRAEKATLLGPIKVMRQEYPQVKSRYIDVIIPPPGSWQEERLIKQLIGDLSNKSADQVIAYRGNHRWVQAYEAVRSAPAPVGAGLRPGGVYLITGGLGGIGMVMAEYLAHSVKARLVLTGREGLPERSEWDRLVGQPQGDEEKRRNICKIRELEEAGAEVEVISADVSEEKEMMDVVRRTRWRFGQINGVIHAAGITGEQSVSPIQEITPTKCGLLFRAKVHGLFVLEKIFRGADMDFCLLLSSLSSVLGGLGFAAYSGSNIFMDTFVYERNRISPIPWISVNWDGWQLKQKDYQQSSGLGAAREELVIRPQEGVEAFQRIISMKMAGQIIVSTGDLQSRIRKWIDLESLDGEQLQNWSGPASRYSRPELETTYVAPRNDLERSIATIWQDLLGIEQVGVHDNFFGLGGHSLLIIQYLSRLRQTFQVEIPIRALFEKPTIVEQGEVIEEVLINEIEALTEEDVARCGRGSKDHD